MFTIKIEYRNVWLIFNSYQDGDGGKCLFCKKVKMYLKIKAGEKAVLVQVDLKYMPIVQAVL